MIWHVLIWAGIGFWLLLWSGLAWLLNALLRGGAEWNGALPAWLEQWRIPAWLADWLPMGWITEWRVWLLDMADALHALWAHAPMLMGWAQPAIGLIWLVGAVCLVLLGVALSVMVAAMRKPMSPYVPPAAAASSMAAASLSTASREPSAKSPGQV